MTENLVALKEIRLEHEEGAPCTAIREGDSFSFLSFFFFYYLEFHMLLGVFLTKVLLVHGKTGCMGD